MRFVRTWLNGSILYVIALQFFDINGGKSVNQHKISVEAGVWEDYVAVTNLTVKREHRFGVTVRGAKAEMRITSTKSVETERTG